MKRSLFLLLTALLATRAAAKPPAVPALPAEPFALPGGEGAIGFDDFAFVPGLHQVLIPAGST